MEDNLKGYFYGRIKPLSFNDPNAAVAIGASIICYKLSNKLPFTFVTEINYDEQGFIDIIEDRPTSIGILNGESHFTKFIYGDKPLPQEKTFSFTTHCDNQTTANIQLLIGRDDYVDLSSETHILIGTLTIKDIPKSLKGDIVINVTIKVNEEGILTASAESEQIKNGSNHQCTIDTKDLINQEDIKKIFFTAQEELNSFTNTYMFYSDGYFLDI